MHTLIFTALIWISPDAAHRSQPRFEPVNIVHDFQSRASCLEAGRFLAEAAPKDSKITWVCQESKARP
jgi:hypothetical protein